MGKKLSINQASTKISKNDKKKQQHQLNTMIQILRPKVYITHSSDFKRLVQDLTGNCPPLSSIPPLVHHQQPPIIEIIEDDNYQQHLHLQETTSPEFSIDVSSDHDTSNNSNNNILVENVAYMMGEKKWYNNNHANDDLMYNIDILSYAYDSPLEEEDIIVPENLSSMLEEGCFHQNNNVENIDHYFPVPPCSDDDLVTLSPPSDMGPFMSYSLYDFDDACYSIPMDQPQVGVYDENIELLHW